MAVLSHTAPRTPHLHRLGFALAITLALFLVELAGGFWTGSLALLADAGHMAMDAFALLFSLFALWLGGLPPDSRRTFGYQRAEVLAAVVNGVALWVVVGFLLREAYQRFLHPYQIKSLEMLGIAVLGLAANVISAALLYRASRENLSLRAAYLNVFYDGLGSLSAIAAGLGLYLTGISWLDPLASVLICILIAVSAFGLVREAIHILLEGAPPHLNLDEVRAALRDLDGVQEVHDLHLWSISSGVESVSGHLVVQKGRDTQEVLKAGAGLLERRFGISHVTLQIES